MRKITLLATTLVLLLARFDDAYIVKKMKPNIQSVPDPRSEARLVASNVSPENQNLLQEASIRFTENKGQLIDKDGKAVKDVLFESKWRGQQMYFRPTGISYVFLKYDSINSEPSIHDLKHQPTTPKTKISGAYRMDLELLNTDPDAKVIGEDATEFADNYYMSSGLVTAKNFGKIIYKSIYPNIDLVYYSKKNKLEYDFVVHPGGDPSSIKMKFIGGDKPMLTANGNLQVKNQLGGVEETSPNSYTQSDNREVASNFVLDQDQLSFSVGEYDHSQTLVIDPIVVSWATFYGGTGDEMGYHVTSDASGNIYMTGTTTSNTAIASPSGFDPNPPTIQKNFIVKFNSAGSRQWATYFGSDGQYSPNLTWLAGIKVDNCGDVVVAGYAQAGPPAVPFITPGVHQTYYGGNTDAIIVKFANNGLLKWGTYYGGAQQDGIDDLAIDGDGNILIAGWTTSPSNISTAGSFQPAFGSAGQNGFLAKFNAAGSQLWGTYYGGITGDTWITSLTLAHNGDIVFAGWTESSLGISTSGTFQVSLNGPSDAFIARFNGSGTRLWGTYFGGPSDEAISCVATDLNGNVYVSGETRSLSGIATPGSFQSAIPAADNISGLLAKFSSTGSRQWATYIGGANKPSYVGFALSALAVSDDGISYTAGQPFYQGFLRFDTYGIKLLDTSFKGYTEYLSLAAGNLFVCGSAGVSFDVTTAGGFQPSFGGGFQTGDAFLIKYNDANIVKSGYPLHYINSNLSAFSVCPGSSLSVPYSLTGSFNAGNSFSAQLSDVNGNFSSPAVIGSIASVTSGTINAFIPSNTVTGSGYKIRVVSSNPAVINCDDQSITINPPVTNTIQSNYAFCGPSDPPLLVGSTPTGGNGIYNYQWLSSYDNSTWSYLAATTKDYDPPMLSQTQYYMRWVTSGGCNTSVSNTVSIRIDQPLSGNTISTSVSAFCGNSDPGIITGAAPTGGNGTYSYQWQNASNSTGPWSNITGATAISYDPPLITSTTYYQRIAISGTCTSASNVVGLVISGPITDNSISNGGGAFCGSIDPVNIVGTTPSGGSSFTYQWQNSTSSSGPWVNISGATAKDFDPPLLTATTYYQRVVNSGACTSVSPAFGIIITSSITNNSVIDNGTQFCGMIDPAPIIGSTPTGGTGSYTYQWLVNTGTTWSNIPGATGKDYDPANVYSGTYFLRQVISGYCTSSSNMVVFQPSAPITSNIISYANYSYCGPSDPFPITGNVPIGGIGNYSYQWQSRPDVYSTWTNIAGATARDYDPPLLTSTTYYQRIANSGNCSIASNQIVVTIVPLPTPLTITASNSSFICSFGGGVTLSVPYAAGVSYQWKVDGNIITGATSSALTVTGAGPSGVYTVDMTTCITVSSSNSITVQIVNDCVGWVYCYSRGQNSSDNWVDRVQLVGLSHAIDNTSGNNGGYADFTYLTPADLEQGSNYPISVYVGKTFHTRYLKVWIDFNQNGLFTDVGEEVISASSSTNLFSANIPIPSFTLLGDTRMRVSLKDAPLLSSCETFADGEVEDYVVNILQASGGDPSARVASTVKTNDNEIKSFGEKDVLYPNPVNTSLHIFIDDRVKDGTLLIMDEMGKQLMQQNQLTQGDMEILVDHLNPGMYIVMIRKGAELRTYKFVKN